MWVLILGTRVQEGTLLMTTEHAGLARALGLGHASAPAQTERIQCGEGPSMSGGPPRSQVWVGEGGPWSSPSSHLAPAPALSRPPVCRILLLANCQERC